MKNWKIDEKIEKIEKVDEKLKKLKQSINGFGLTIEPPQRWELVAARIIRICHGQLWGLAYSVVKETIITFKNFDFY